MASLLLDENISCVIADQIVLKDKDARVLSIHRWRGGEMLGAGDEMILEAALEENLTLVTYDLSTIKPLLTEWAEDGRTHAGVIFIDDKSIAGNDYGALIKAVMLVWERLQNVDFREGVLFLTPGM